MKKYLLNIILFLISVSFSLGQGCFNANVTRGCAPLNISITNCYGFSTNRYDYGDGSAVTPLTTHTYNSPGKYTITQITFRSGGAVDELKKVDYIEVLSPRKPTYKLDICEGKNITLTVNDDIDTAYAINWGDGSGNILLKPNIPLQHTYSDLLIKTISISPISCGFSETVSFYPLFSIEKPDISRVIVNNQHSTNGQITIQFNAIISQRYYLQQSIKNVSAYVNIDILTNLSGLQNIVINNLNTVSNQYCYRLVAFDDCSNPTKTSEEICSVINTVTPNNNYNNISWTDPGNVSVYHIFKNNTEIATSGTTSYIDNAVNCGVNYCYFIKAELNSFDLSGNNKLESISDTVCITAISTNTPTPIQNLNSSTGSNISLSWNKPVGLKKYEILRSVNGGAFSNYSTSLVNSFTDGAVNIPADNYCYKVNYKDSCDLASAPGTTTCPIILKLTIDNSNNMLNHLTWSAYIGDWPLGINSYYIEKLDENNNIISSTNVNSLLSFDDLNTNVNSQLIKYRIKAVSSGPDNPSYSNIVEIKYEGAIYLPNAFTPDGDGINDLFFAKGKFIKDFRLSVFNKWGEVVYFSEDLNEGWNGTYKGTDALNDAYAYLVEATDFWGKKTIKRGSVTLLR